MYQRPYADYDTYPAHQKRKTAKPELRERLYARWQQDLERFGASVKVLSGRVPVGAKALCLGARLGGEVVALQYIGYDAVGIDLVPCPPLVQEGDFHDIPFPDDSFGLVYTNSVDHVRDFEKFAAEIRRVLNADGWLMVTLHMHTFGSYEATRIDSVDEFTAMFADFEVIEQSSNGKEGSALRITLLMQRRT